jgi:hypothetical protein
LFSEFFKKEAVVDAPDEVTSSRDEEEISFGTRCHCRLEIFWSVDESTREAVEGGDPFLSEVVEVITRFFSLLFVVLLPGLVLDVVNVLGHLILFYSIV